jgi:OOP family OmpA-OmpF porin
MIKPPRRERKDWQYYQGAHKKLTMPHRQDLAVCQSLIAFTCQTFVLSLVVLPVSLPGLVAKYRSACKRQRMRMRKPMRINSWVKPVSTIPVTLVALIILAGSAVMQGQTVKGVINGRSGATMTLQTVDTPKLVVLLTPTTEVGEVQGVLKARTKQMAMTCLIPGLPVEVQGSTNDQGQLVANSVKFKGNDLKAAMDAQAGLQPTVAAQQADQQKIQQNEQALAEQQAALASQQAQLSAADQKIAANKAAIAADNKRFGELGDYNIMGEVTVLFGNGKTTVDPQYKPQLSKLAEQALTITGYVIQVKGYASAVGSASLNQRLSVERANAVTQYLEQDANVPLTNMLAPGAMGTADQVAPDKTAEGQAENRRVVVMILQNKGIAGS